MNIVLIKSEYYLTCLHFPYQIIDNKERERMVIFMKLCDKRYKKPRLRDVHDFSLGFHFLLVSFLFSSFERVWSTTVPSKMQTRSHNVVRESFAVTKDVSGIQVPADLFKLLITAEMVNIIVKKTNEKAAQLHQKSVKNIQMLCGIGKK
ncbi:hypothetical protein T01_6922 [Trichinella spiralis]|uniref:Uncharacterized protein n=1 Tax=Trichinella spiralis TaxID=6334 RepID=A0A0V1BTN6_TRISP|nr:hypothetical protein T01_8491 [Trichinella spiralis]KRY40287.1 hypothetical protein T01_6922 [Trichinella spiralis]